jgi:alkanesulfonate monooxygenase SsuD/methylene tetrahydromethanopterin reductase-like flavin-dependent oxidoreductase (luciferase family)
LPRYSRTDGRATPLLIAGRGPRMLQLVARHADAWNTAWIGPAAQLPPRMEGLQGALTEAGRDPASLEITVGVNVVLPEYSDGEHPALEVTPNSITGSPEELALELRAYAQMGVGHIQAALEPTTPPAIAHLGKAVALLRAAETAEAPPIPTPRD